MSAVAQIVISCGVRTRRRRRPVDNADREGREKREEIFEFSRHMCLGHEVDVVTAEVWIDADLPKDVGVDVAAQDCARDEVFCDGATEG